MQGAPAGWWWVRKLISTCCVLANYMASGWDLCCTWLAKKQVTRAQKGFLASTPTWCVSRYKRALVQSTSRNRHSLRNHTRRKGGDQEEASHGAQSSRRGMLFLWHLILPPLFKMIRVSRHQTSYPKPASRNSAKRQACSSRRKLPVDVLPALLSLNLVPSIQLGGNISPAKMFWFVSRKLSNLAFADE